jgi:hypothetical protein
VACLVVVVALSRPGSVAPSTAVPGKAGCSTTGCSRLVCVPVGAVPCIDKGADGDPGEISATYELFYLDDRTSVRGAFTLPSPWLLNENDKAKYVNPAAPAGPSQAKLGGVRIAKQVRFGAKGLGDLQAIDILDGLRARRPFSIFTYERQRRHLAALLHALDA